MRTFPRDVRVLAYADIHHGERANGRTQEDMEDIENQITQLAIERKVHWVVFVGDAFKHRNPHDECKTRWLQCRAERTRAITEFYEATGHPISQFDLVGNHCRWYKATDSGHVFDALDLVNDGILSATSKRSGLSYRSMCPHIISDKVQTFDCSSAVFYTLPAQTIIDESRWDFNVGPTLRIALVHGMVKGCSLNQSATVTAQDGIPLELLDRPEFDFVLAGDIHIPQQLPFKHTRGGYTGSTLQLDESDRGEQRGFLYLEFLGGETEPSVEFIPSNVPQLQRVSWDTSQPFPWDPEFESSLLTVETVNTASLSPEAIEVVLAGVRERVVKLTALPSPVQIQKGEVIITASEPLEEFRQYLGALGLEQARHDRLMHRLPSFLRRE